MAANFFTATVWRNFSTPKTVNFLAAINNPHFLHLFFGNKDAISDTMRLISALKTEEDLQKAWREEREKQFQSDVERIPERGRMKSIPFRG